MWIQLDKNQLELNIRILNALLKREENQELRELIDVLELENDIRDE